MDKCRVHAAVVASSQEIGAARNEGLVHNIGDKKCLRMKKVGNICCKNSAAYTTEKLGDEEIWGF